MARIPWNKGLKMGPLSEETKRRIGNANRGRVHTEEHKRKISETLKALHFIPWNAGKHLPAMMREKIAAAGRGRKHTEETKEKIRAYHIAHSPMRGKNLSSETLALISRALKGRRFTPEHRLKLSNALRGENSRWWKGGVTPARILIRTSRDYVRWRKAVFERDDYRCFDCGERGGELEAHHIYSFALFPRLRLMVENGITLCRKCHDRTKKKGPRVYSYALS